MKKDELYRLQNAWDHMVILEGHLKVDSLDSLVVLDAVCLRLGAAIEELAGLSDERRHEYFGEKWPAMWAFRNRIAHAYLRIDDEIVKNTVRQDVPALKLVIEQAIRMLGSRPSSDFP